MTLEFDLSWLDDEKEMADAVPDNEWIRILRDTLGAEYDQFIQPDLVCEKSV